MRETAVDLQLEIGQLDLDAGTALAQAIRYEEILGAANERLAALEPPPELADTYAEFVDVRNRLNDVRLERIAALETADAKAQAAIGAEIAELTTSPFPSPRSSGSKATTTRCRPSRKRKSRPRSPRSRPLGWRATATSSSTPSSSRLCSGIAGGRGMHQISGEPRERLRDLVRVGQRLRRRLRQRPLHQSWRQRRWPANQRALFFDEEAGIWRLWSSEEAD